MLLSWQMLLLRIKVHVFSIANTSSLCACSQLHASLIAFSLTQVLLERVSFAHLSPTFPFPQNPDLPEQSPIPNAPPSSALAPLLTPRRFFFHSPFCFSASAPPPPNFSLLPFQDMSYMGTSGTFSRHMSHAKMAVMGMPVGSVSFVCMMIGSTAKLIDEPKSAPFYCKVPCECSTYNCLKLQLTESAIQPIFSSLNLQFKC